MLCQSRTLYLDPIYITSEADRVEIVNVLADPLLDGAAAGPPIGRLSRIDVRSLPALFLALFVQLRDGRLVACGEEWRRSRQPVRS